MRQTSGKVAAATAANFFKVCCIMLQYHDRTFFSFTTLSTHPILATDWACYDRGTLYAPLSIRRRNTQQGKPSLIHAAMDPF